MTKAEKHLVEENLKLKEKIEFLEVENKILLDENIIFNQERFAEDERIEQMLNDLAKENLKYVEMTKDEIIEDVYLRG